MTETSSLSLKSRIRDFKDLQKFCLTYEHAIREVAGSIALYQGGAHEAEPISRRASTFVYSFFVFNNMYSIDWEKSLEHPDCETVDAACGLSQQEQFWKMVDVCYQSDARDAAVCYSKYLREYLQRFGIHNLRRQLRGIDSDQNHELEKKLRNQYDERRRKDRHEITMQSIEDFRQSFMALYSYEALEHKAAVPEGEHQNHLNNVLYFVYVVRCNVFHGRKLVAVRYITRSQDIRLLLYSAALLATNQIVLEHADKILDL